MEKLVYELRDNGSYWSVAQFMPYPKSQMHMLQMSFNEQYYWMSFDFKDDRVIIWDSFDEKHDAWENISKLYLSKKNYEQIVAQWNKNAENPAKYLVFARDDQGFVVLEAKESLLQEDLDAIEQDMQAKINHEKHKK